MEGPLKILVMGNWFDDDTNALTASGTPFEPVPYHHSHGGAGPTQGSIKFIPYYGTLIE